MGRGCTEQAPSGKLYCPRCWSNLPAQIQKLTRICYAATNQYLTEIDILENRFKELLEQLK
jgi:hypothetical protein